MTCPKPCCSTTTPVRSVFNKIAGLIPTRKRDVWGSDVNRPDETQFPEVRSDLIAAVYANPPQRSVTEINDFAPRFSPAGRSAVGPRTDSGSNYFPRRGRRRARYVRIAHAGERQLCWLRSARPLECGPDDDRRYNFSRSAELAIVPESGKFINTKTLTARRRRPSARIPRPWPWRSVVSPAVCDPWHHLRVVPTAVLLLWANRSISQLVKCVTRDAFVIQSEKSNRVITATGRSWTQQIRKR